MRNQQGDPLLKLDARGRVTIGRYIRRNGVEPNQYYRMTFGEYGSIHLLPVRIELEREAA